jgi:hypothetical protein
MGDRRKDAGIEATPDLFGDDYVRLAQPRPAKKRQASLNPSSETKGSEEAPLDLAIKLPFDADDDEDQAPGDAIHQAKRGKLGKWFQPADRIARENVAAPASYQIATPYEVVQAYSYLQGRILRARFDDRLDPDATILLLTILLGRTAGQLNGSSGLWLGAMRLEEYRGHTCAIFDLDLGAKGIGKEQLPLLDRHPVGPIRIPIPLTLAVAARAIQAAQLPVPSDLNLTTVLREVRAHTDRSITEGRLAAYLPAQLKRAGVDSAIVGALVGRRPEDHPQLSYTRMAATDLINAYQDVVAPIWETYGEFIDWSNFSTKERIGTALVPKAATLRSVFAIVNSSIEETKSLSDKLAVSIHHNSLAFRTVTALQIATVHRPIRSPFGLLSDFDLVRNLVLISDKENRVTSSNRLIKFGPLARHALDLWLAHLRRLAATQRQLSPKLAETADAALAGRKELFFLALNNRPVIYQASLIDKLFDKLLPLQANWPRHYVRSTLQHVSRGELLDMLLGHGSLGLEAQGPWSGLALSDADELAAATDKLILELRLLP